MATRPSKESVDAENQEAGDTMGELPGGMAKMQIPTTTANALSNRGPLSSNRGRQRRITKENMLGHDNLLAGTDEKGVRIRILTAQLTGWRAAKVFPDMEKAGLSQSKYVGETIPYDGETTPNGQSVTVPGKLRHGHGEITYADGSHFVGQWENDVRSGTGTFKFACGDVYEGEWKNGMYHGKGKYTGFKSDSYEGEWAEDQPHGYGSYTYKYQLNTAATLANRSFTYTGNWVAGKREGHHELLAGTDDQGVRIRIFTAQLTGMRAAKVFPGTKEGLTFSKYVGETIPYDGETTPNGQSVTVPGKLRHGQGEITYGDGSHFVGQWENDVRSGNGVFTYACGDVYEGEWKGGMYHGSGTYTGFNSDSYAGEWKEDRMHGQGSYTYRDSGDVYEGSWIEGKREGYGKEICGNGDVYQGEFKNDARVSLSLLKQSHLNAGQDENGCRIRIFTAKLTGTHAAIVTPDMNKPGLSECTYTGDTIPDPSNRQGLTVAGQLRHGHGEIKYKSGSHFVGQWINDKRSGRGVYTFACGDVYDGGFLDGEYHGPGKYTGKDSDCYDGEWKRDKMDGFGRYAYSISGDVYEGQWREGKFHGKGRYTSADGSVHEGEYEAGERVVPVALEGAGGSCFGKC